VLATDFRAFLPGETEPPELMKQHLHVFGAAALQVGIFDAQQENTAAARGVQVVEQGRTQVPQVDFPGRAGCEPGFWADYAHRCSGLWKPARMVTKIGRRRGNRYYTRPETSTGDML
jgi:hypothetical protein